MIDEDENVDIDDDEVEADITPQSEHDWIDDEIDDVMPLDIDDEVEDEILVDVNELLL